MSQRARNRVKGALFEAQVEILLKRSGYKTIEPDGRSTREGKLRGRGGWHQIDAFGYYSYGVPCLYPIRVICEAKNYSTKVGLPVIRNFIGAFKDIAENYFVERLGDPTDYLLTKRFTDAGVIFSTSGFTPQAQDYAYAQGVFLVSYEDNPVLSPLLNLFDALIGVINVENAAESIFTFKRWIFSKMESPERISPADSSFSTEGFRLAFSNYVGVLQNIRTSYLGTASGVYPIHLLSRDEIPWNLFQDRDEISSRIYYNSETENCLQMVVRGQDSRESRFYISIPKIMIANYRDRMLEFKERFFDHVDIPATHGNIRRVLTFRLDTEWIDGLRRRRRQA